MRRLTLILSDLFVPSEAAGSGAPLTTLDLPNFDWLLRFSAGPERIAEWRHWLAVDVGRPDLARMSIADACAKATLPEATPATVWLATPVHLEARIDHVRLADRGLLRLGEEERDFWRQEFARTFGPEFALHDAGDRGFLLSGGAAIRVASVDPARLLDTDIGRALPTGPSAGELRRLGTEVEMWLHGATANAARERRRERRVSALWLWGGGLIDGGAVEAGTTIRAPDSAPRYLGGDPYLSALAGSSVMPPPVSFGELSAGDSRCIVEFAPMSGRQHETLSALESNWFSPARDALGRGEIESVDLIANDRHFRVAARSGWRWWRRRSSWLAQLSRPLL
jgi:hypothetical protein